MHCSSIARVALGVAGLLTAASPAFAQTHALTQETVTLNFDSGIAANDGQDPEVVISFPIYMHQTAWMRLFFGDVELAGDPALGTGSILRVTSMLDGGQQRLNAESLAQWQNSSAYFNGDSVLVEVLAYPGTGMNQVKLDRVTFETADTAESQCGSQDNRAPSSDARSARLLPQGCTGWLINDASGCQLTAGHCGVGGSNVLQFNVPDSSSSGSLNNPGPEDQYVVDGASVQSNGGQGVGNDYAYFGTFANSNTGLTAFQAQGSAFAIVNPPPFQSGQQVRITGFGVDSGTRNQTQQTHVGPRENIGGTTVEYMTDTEGGNSGSPVILESTGDAIGIHTHGGCSSSSGNFGTGINHSGLQVFLANPLGVCDSTTTARFTASPLSGTAPLAVSFGNTSGGGVTSQAWDFGDGGTSTAIVPTYTYNTPGTYTVSLTVTGSTGVDTETKTDYIVVTAPPSGDATCVSFNGTGANPDVFTCVTDPIIGQNWLSVIDGNGIATSGLVFTFGFEGAIPAGLPLGPGELLVDPTTPQAFFTIGFLIGGTANMSTNVPNDVSLIGFEINAQGLFNSVNGAALLTNAIQLVFGTF